MSAPFVLQPYASWGRVIRRDHWMARPQYRDELAGLLAATGDQGATVLGAGLGRSYGDSGLDPAGRLICAPLAGPVHGPGP